ncbi:hypothetical protein GCM10023262_12800 [Bartonella pachyuromydis]|uniref:Uncharacterized protein n=1 Tax=Bartonella pachyuromydis TaxID=931097 RepID=A0ABP8VJ97_9HYPH
MQFHKYKCSALAVLSPIGDRNIALCMPITKQNNMFIKYKKKIKYLRDYTKNQHVTLKDCFDAT